MRIASALVVISLVACGPGSRNGTGDDDGSGTDASTTDAPSPPGGGGTTFVYAHTSSTLYRVDPDTLAITMVGDFVWSTGSDSMTDIAIDKTGMMVGVSATTVYAVDVTNAHATKLSAGLTGDFNGLSFVPAAMLNQTGDDVLVATRNADGAVFRVDPATGQTTQIGDMGSSFSSSGDLVAVAGFGTVQTADNGLSPDRLVTLAPQTFKATAIGTDTGFGDIWGIAYWKNKIFGFTDAGEFILIDPATGKGTLVQGNGPAWWGAAVTTVAPILE
jgi:hypothetical protein